MGTGDHCLFVFSAQTSAAQELGGSIQGECTDFQAVPGHGLQCIVSGVEEYAVREGEISESLTKHLYSSTEVSLVPSNCKELLGTAYVPRKYQVIIASYSGALMRTS